MRGYLNQLWLSTHQSNIIRALCSYDDEDNNNRISVSPPALINARNSNRQRQARRSIRGVWRMRKIKKCKYWRSTRFFLLSLEICMAAKRIGPRRASRVKLLQLAINTHRLSVVHNKIGEIRQSRKMRCAAERRRGVGSICSPRLSLLRGNHQAIRKSRQAGAAPRVKALE